MTDDDVRFEASFEIEAAPLEAWAALEQLRADYGQPDAAPPEWWLPGFEARATEVCAEPGVRLEVVKAEQPCQGTAIVMTFEHAGSGSRITIVQSGFDPAFVRMAGESFWAHADLIAANAERFFQTGVIAGGEVASAQDLPRSP